MRGNWDLRSGRLCRRRSGENQTMTSPIKVSVDHIIISVCASLCLLGVMPSAAGATGDANEAACPNEGSSGYRASLPDCRAYEQVTPANKEGALVNAPAYPSVAPDGSSVVGQSSGAFAGLLSDELPELGEADYRFTRTDAGWFTTPLNPFDGTVTEGLGLHDAISQPASVGLGVERLSLVQTDGLLSEIGPVSPPTLGAVNHLYRIDAAASEASHGVVFSIENPNFYWPFDTSLGSPSLYEYVGTNNTEPGLVGVSGGQGSTTLISQCATELGVGNEQYNSVSANGEKILFTARECEGSPPVRELYARVGGSKTVAISEPSKEDCESCEIAPSAVRAAVFRGASEDGSKVFFTTEQRLLPSQMGENLYEYNFNGAQGHRIVLVSAGSTEPEVQGVARVSLDGSHIYFVAKGVLTSTPNSNGQRAQIGGDNLYAFGEDAQYPAGHIAFVARLCTGSELSGSTVDAACPAGLPVNSEGDTSDEELWGRGDAEGEQNRPVQATPDGQFLVFTSYGDLTAGDTSTARQVFQYDAQTEHLVRVSISQEGYNDNGNADYLPGEANDAAIVTQDYAYGSREGAIARTMSDNGSYVFFQSPVGLTPQAFNEVQVAEGGFGPLLAQNVYEYHEGHIFLISDRDASAATTFDRGASGQDRGMSLIGTSVSGRDVFFRTADSLVPQDTDTQVDFYDARVDGGFSAPQGATPCEGETCQEPATTPPSLAAPGSTIITGTGNLAVPLVSTPTPAKKTPTQVRAEKLSKALKACHKIRSRASRATCEKKAKANYGTRVRAKKTDRRVHS
jgi:hypothetical protein